MKTLRGKVVWITGASSGIGRALAIAAHRQSAIVILSARRVNELKSVASLCTGEAPVDVLPIDLTDHESLYTCAREAIQLAGRAEILWDVDDPQNETGGTRRYWDFKIDSWVQIKNSLPGSSEFLDFSPHNPVTSVRR